MIDEERLTSNDPEIAAAAAAAPASPHVLPPSYRHKRLLCAHFKQRATSSAGGGNQALPDIKAGESVATISPEKLAEISEVSGVRFADISCSISTLLLLASFNVFHSCLPTGPRYA